MGLEFFRRSVELVDHYLKPGQPADYTIQTNGTKLDAEWAGFFKEHEFLVGISIDGPREIHDTFRLTRGGRGSFDQVMRGLGHLRAGGVECNILTTVHAANEHRGREVYRFLRDECGARFMQFIPIIERVAEVAKDGTVPWSSWRDRPLYLQDGAIITGRSVNPDGYGRFLIDVFEEWGRHDVARVYVQMFDTALANWVGERPSLCVHCETCGLALALEHTVTSTRAITSWSPATCWATSLTGTSSIWSPPSSSGSSGLTSATRSRATAANATFASPATEAARRTASPRPPTARQA